MSNVLGVDWGEARTGLALTSTEARLPVRLKTVTAKEFLAELPKLIKSHQIETIVLGLPRGLEGQETEQSGLVRQTADEIRQTVPDITLILQDEAGTSIEAEERLRNQGAYEQEHIDQEAAVIILEDYLSSL